MTVYLLIVEDRHTDVEVRVFATVAAAVASAKELQAEYDYEPDEPDEPIDGWIYHATLSCDGDCLRVQSAVVRD